MASAPYDSKSRDSNIQLFNAQVKLKEFVYDSNEVLTKYLLILESKGFIRYHREQGLYTPTDKGIHFLQIYNMLSDLLRE
jgi:predicted transcriptional regulator